MSKALKWGMQLFLGTLCLILLAVAFVYYLATRSLPDYDADYRVPGITAPVEIVRDTANVPHIFGETDEDSYFGLGFVHAQDRLWQMTMMRRTAQGRLSELFGTRTVKIDEVLRRLDLYRLANAAYDAQDDYTKRALTAYAAGVNAWISQINEDAMGRGAPEFFLFDPSIAPWQPADSLAVVKLMGLKLSTQIETEVLRARAALILPPERLRDLLPEDPSQAMIELPDRAWLPEDTGMTYAARSAPDFRTDPLSPLKHRAFASASNVWAAAPERSTSGGTLLANDPHLGFTAPSIWYLARIELESGGVIGGSIPGMPAILSGRNAEIAWGITSAYVDDLDVYIEKLDPENTDQYLDRFGNYVPFRTEGAVLSVKDAAPVTLTLRWTDRGPVMPPDIFDLGLVTPNGHVASLAWTVLEADDPSLSAALSLMRQQAVPDAIDVMAPFVAPAQNLVVVGKDDVAMQVVGKIPRRSAGHDSMGRLPAPGWRADNHWQGYFDYGLNPKTVDPDSGILGNTNNKTSDRPFPLHVSFDWGDTQRVHRWEKLMQDRQVHSRENFIETQLDTVSLPARSLLPLIGAELWFTGEASEQGTTERRRREALDLLAEWNGEMNEHQPEPLIYMAWIRALQERLIEDELGGALAATFTHVDPLFIERVYRNIDGAAIWCDIQQSAPTETCAEIARMALDDALIWIDETYGGTLASLHWGDAHQAQHDHEVLGDVPLLGWLVNIRQSTSGGDHTLQRGLTAGTGAHPFRNVHGAGYRGVYDMADPDSSVFITSTGQSGHPFSRFYDNLGELWRRGEYVPMSLDPALARAASTGVTMLQPAQ